MDLPASLAWALALTLALVFGSFLNVCIARLPRHRSIAWPGSRCPRCASPIRARDNLPVLSWFVLRGRCRDCSAHIAVRYPLVEAGYAALVAASLARFGFTPAAAGASVFCFLLLGLLVMDLETMLLPDAFTLPGIGLGLLWAWFSAEVRAAPGRAAAFGALGQAVLAGAGWALGLLAIRWAYYAVRRRQGLGLGDVKLVAMLAVWLGVERTGVTFLLAVVAAGLAGVALALSQTARKRGGADPRADWRTMRLPLGAFLCAGALCGLFFGSQLLTWYLSLWP